MAAQEYIVNSGRLGSMFGGSLPRGVVGRPPFQNNLGVIYGAWPPPQSGHSPGGGAWPPPQSGHSPGGGAWPPPQSGHSPGGGAWSTQSCDVANATIQISGPNSPCIQVSWSGLKGNSGDGLDLPFPEQKQEQSEWCWAAVAAAVDSYYNPVSAWSQCEIASKVISHADCCTAADQFNWPEFLEDALDSISHLRRWQEGSISFEQLQSEILAGRPVCAQVRWEEGFGSHFVILVGFTQWSSGLCTVDVADPALTNSTTDYETFRDCYVGSGVWETTFFTNA